MRSRKHFMVTGATSGVGAAIAQRLAAEGAALTLVGRSESRLRELASTLPGAAQVSMACIDLAATDAAARIDSLGEACRHLDGLIHCAGQFRAGAFTAAPLADLTEMFTLHVQAVATLTRALLPALRAALGSVVVVNSSVVQRPAPEAPYYAASKHAARALTDSIRAAVNPTGVRVTALFLGRVATPMQEEVARNEGRPYHPEHLIQPGDVAEAVRHAVFMPVTCEVTEIHVRPRLPPADRPADA